MLLIVIARVRRYADFYFFFIGRAAISVSLKVLACFGFRLPVIGACSAVLSDKVDFQGPSEEAGPYLRT